MMVTAQKSAKWLFWLAIFTVTLLSLLPIDHPQVASQDKLNHLLAWAILGGLLLLSWPFRWSLLVYLVGYSGLIEVAQGVTGYRLFSLADWLANTLGVSLSILIYSLIQWSRK